MSHSNSDAEGRYKCAHKFYLSTLFGPRLNVIPRMQIFVDGLKKHFQLGPNLHRMFPRLSELTEIHLEFLRNLRRRQRKAPVVETISDILLEQFSGDAANKLKAVYGEFCSRHRDAVDIYKYFLAENAAFSAFVKHCQVRCPVSWIVLNLRVEFYLDVCGYFYFLE